MNVDFFAHVNKSSGTPFNPSGSTETAIPGFREQLNRAMRDDDRKNESVIEKKPAGRKKPLASAETQNSANAGEKAAAPKTNDHPDRKYADNETTAAGTQDHAEETSETAGSFVLNGEDTGFYGELKDAETSGTENVYTFTPTPVETSETENVYTFAPMPGETSETENAYAPGQDGFADSSVSSSADSQIFPPVLIKDDSGFAEMVNIEAVTGNAVPGADLDVALNLNAGAEAVSSMITGRQTAAPPPETADVNISQNASFPDGDAVNGAKEPVEATAGNAEQADAESARPAVKEILEDGLFPKNSPPAQNSDSNAPASLRGETVRKEGSHEYKTTDNTEPADISKQFSVRASFEDDDLLLERMAAQSLRPQQGATFAKASENAGKTAQIVETSVNMTSGAAKAEAPASARSVNASDQEFIIELAGRIQSQIRGGREMIRIQLHPEELGRLDIRAEAGRNGIIARIAAESIDVKKLLESNLQTLQHTLEARGLKVDRLHIIVEENLDTALFADGGRYGHAGTGLRNSEVSEFSTFPGAGIESPQEEDAGDLSAEAARRGAGFYTVG